MQMLQLQYFKSLAETEHLSRTAAEMYISPSALSASINRLEEELGVQLFNRIGRNIQLNENGKEFYYHVKRVLYELDQVCEELRSGANSAAPSLTVSTSTPSIWEKPFLKFIMKNPGLAFNHHTVDVDKLRSNRLQVRDGEPDFDFIITACANMSTEDYNYTILIPNDQPMLAVYEGHPFAERKEISLYEAKNEPFIALDKQFGARQFFDIVFELAGFKPRIVAQVDFTLRASLVKNGVGITMASTMALESTQLEGLRFIKIISPANPRPQAIFWKKGRELSPQAKAFKHFMINYYKDFARDS